MPMSTPVTKLDERYSDPAATAIGWEETREALEGAELFWVSTVRADGRPHVTPVVAAWAEGAIWFTTGADEQKFVNLRANPHVVLTTGCNTWDQGFDVVLHGEAVIVRDLPLLQQVAAAFLAKYGDDWAFEVGDDGTFRGHGISLVYQLIPVEALGFRKDPFSHTRWDFTA